MVVLRAHINGIPALIQEAQHLERERIIELLATSPKFGFFSNDGEGNQDGEGKNWWREKTAEIRAALTPKN